MMTVRRILPASSLFLALFVAGVFSQDSARSPADGNAAFAIDLYKKLSSDSGNLFLSPYSISVALAMTYRGAKGNTETEMANVLHFNNIQDVHKSFATIRKSLDSAGKGKNCLLTANSLWPQKGYPFLPAYTSFLKKWYGVSISYLDYKRNIAVARRTINTWVSGKTQGKIIDLLPEGALDNATRLVLINAIYFKGVWATQFDKAKTGDGDFFPLAGDSVRVPLMRMTSKFNYAQLEGMKFLELPYTGERLSLVVLLPDERAGLPSLESALTPATIKQGLDSLCKQKVEVAMPRFKIEKGFMLNETLRSMGMASAFSADADFSGMDGTKNLFITAAVHKAFVEVNEEGTEAAAATGVAVGRMSVAPKTPAFIADHPFLFIIRDRVTGTILFIGRVVNPGA